MSDDEEKDSGQEPAHDDYIDRSAWPILRVTFPEHLTMAGLDVHFAALKAIAKKGENFAAIVNLDAMRSQTRELRQHAAAHLKDLDSLDSTRCLLGVAHVSNHWLSRAGLTVVLSLSPPPYPNRAFRHMEDAEAWVQTLLED